MSSDTFVIAGRDGRLARRVLELLRAARVPCRVEVKGCRTVPDPALAPVTERAAPPRRARVLAVGPVQLSGAEGGIVRVDEAVRAEMDGSFAPPEHALGSAADATASAVLRVAPYAEALIPRLAWAAQAGRLYAVEGHPGIAYITLDDAALVAATVLTSGYQGAEALDITGPRVVTWSQLARALSRVLGRPIPHAPVPWNRYQRELAMSPPSPPDLALIRASDLIACGGGFARSSPAAQEITGVRMRSIEQFLEQHVELIRQHAARLSATLSRTQAAAQPGV